MYISKIPCVVFLIYKYGMAMQLNSIYRRQILTSKVDPRTERVKYI